MITCESCDKSLTLQVDGFENGRIEITDLKTSSEFTSSESSQSVSPDYFFPHVGPVTSISFGSIDDIPCFTSTGSDGKLILWTNLNGLWKQNVLYKSKIPITSASFSKDSSVIVFADQEGNINSLKFNNDEFRIDKNLYFSTNSTGIHQVCFIILSDNNKSDFECLAIITPEGKLQIYKYVNNRYSDKPFTFQFSKSYVKGIAPLDRCYIAGICFGNIVRVFDIKMFSLSEINLKIDSSTEITTEEKFFYINDFPIFALRWEEPLRKLVIYEQKPHQVIDMMAKIEMYVMPTIKKEKYVFTKDPLGTWTQIK